MLTTHHQVFFNINIFHWARFISLATAFHQAEPSATSSDVEYFPKYSLENIIRQNFQQLKFVLKTKFGFLAKLLTYLKVCLNCLDMVQ